MFAKLKSSLAVALFVGGGSFANADEAHHSDVGQEDVMTEKGSHEATSGMMETGKGMMASADHHEMMLNMMSMMMKMLQTATSMGASIPSGGKEMHQMDKDIMGLIGGSMNPIATDDDGDGRVPFTEMGDRVQSLYTMADTDENGMISLDEFEMLHGMLMKEQMVDRFQHLDADGNGNVTQRELKAPAVRMKNQGSQKAVSKGGTHQLND